MLVQDAEIILLDEPFNAIDAKTVVDLIALIKRWHGESRTVMVVVHDLNLVREHFPETLLLARQPVAWGDTIETLRPENLLRARRFDEAWHDDAPWCEPELAHERHGTIMRMRTATTIITPLRPARGVIGMYDYLIAPFVEYGFMQRALLGSLMLSLSGCPVGVFLMLRRMSLTGDAMAHAILPGAAAGFLLYGLEIIPMTIGGLVAGVIVAMGAGLVSRFTVQKEDASMAAFYLISLARRRADRVDPRLERRPDACAVRHGAGAQRRGAAADRPDRRR